MGRGSRFGSGAARAAAAGVAIVAAALAASCAKRDAATRAAVSTEAVERRDIAVTVEATGTVEPVNLVEVKSKASGQITRMPVEIGSVVRAGDLLAQIDPRDVQNAFDQSQAALVSAEAKARVSRDQKKRADELFAQQVITATEHEQAELDDASAQAALVGARTNLDLAKQRLEDATVRAPIAGTVLAKPVSVGQVISSATSSVSGGTTLLQMADLQRIRMRAMVVETDIGKVHEGQAVTVVVDAYPSRTFDGTVEKIEPQAVVSQSVTQFPVLVSISNEAGLLLPGMNGEVTMRVDERANVLAVPIDGLRNAREIVALAKQLGVNADSIANTRRAGGGGNADVAAAGLPGAPSGSGAAAGGGAARDTVRGARARGEAGRDGARFTPEQRARFQARRAARGGAAGGGASGGAASGAFAGAGGGAFERARTQVALLKTASGYEARRVRVGLTNYDYAEVLDGLAEGDEVVMLGTLEMQQERQDLTNRVRQRMGGGITGSSGASGGARGGR